MSFTVENREKAKIQRGGKGGGKRQKGEKAKGGKGKSRKAERRDLQSALRRKSHRKARMGIREW